VVGKRSAGRAHFRAILNHVLSPEHVTHAFAIGVPVSGARQRVVSGWPYMDSLRLCDVTVEHIQQLTSQALLSGYSVQTVTHVRNVIRAIFSHASKTGCYKGANPAVLVALPAMTRKVAHSLTLVQLKQVMELMRYPEKYIALLSLLTDMNVAEVCGLQWKHVNLSNETILVDDECIPARMIAIRAQRYRGEFALVIKGRKRSVRVPELLRSALRDLKNRSVFTAPADFVLTKRHSDLS
jgi:integrase